MKRRSSTKHKRGTLAAAPPPKRLTVEQKRANRCWAGVEQQLQAAGTLYDKKQFIRHPWFQAYARLQAHTAKNFAIVAASAQALQRPGALSCEAAEKALQWDGSPGVLAMFPEGAHHA